MILNPNDPSGLGLFSRCARNAACRNKKERPKTATNKISAKQLNINQNKTKDPSQNWMGKIQSRDQRERKYKRQLTPSVGQYNPQAKSKTKLVWDVLKIYQKKNKQMRKLQQLHAKIDKPITKKLEAKIENQDSKQNFQTNNQRISAHIQQNERQKNLLNQTQLFGQLIRINGTNTSANSNCMVNMSRMTGRSQTVRHSIQNDYSKTIGESRYDQNVDLNKSIQHIKTRTKKNIYFKKMIGRKQDEKPIGTANIYDCNLDLIRFTRKGFNDFGLLKGREDQTGHVKKYSANTINYYDFDQYFWKSSSNIYQNTKKNLISFDKQSPKKR